MKVLVCGGAGYIGSHTIREIRRSTKWEVVILDNFSSGHWGTIPSDIIVEVGDIRDVEFLSSVFRKHKPDAVMHFCASIVVPDSVADPLGYYDNNVVGTQRLLSVMNDFKCQRFIFSSTAALFGHPDRVPIQPDDPTRPESPYGDTKLIIEWLLKSCHVAYGTRYVCLRYFNACGADASGEIGERHEPESHLIPVIIDAALGKRKQISIFGTDFPTKDGTCVRDYIHVTDLATAHIRALEYLADPKNPPAAFNLGTGVGTTVKEVVDTVKSVTGTDFKVILADRRAGDPATLVADPQKALDILKWKAKYSLKDMVATAYSFHKKWDAIDRSIAPFKTDFKKVLGILHDYDQMHLFEKWSGVGQDNESKKSFLSQLEKIDKAYAGGLAKYLQNAQRLLAKTRDGYNPWEGCKPSVPKNASITWKTESFDDVEKFALNTVLKTAGYVLVAGGLGERLGYNGIKIALPVDSVTMQSHLEHYVTYIQNWGTLSVEGRIPLCIMTSDDTHELTLKLLRRLKLDDKVFLVKQEKVPALTNNHAMMCLAQPYVLNTKPHGSGDVHTLLYSSGIAAKWHQSGIQNIVFIQDTNSLAMRCLPFTLGTAASQKQDMTFMCIPRTPGSAIGCVVRLTRPNGSAVVANVEYNVLDSFLRSSGGAGDVAGADGLSPYPGNTNTLVLRLAPYLEALQNSHGAVPEYVAPKYNNSPHIFKSPTRVECTMEDISQVMPNADKVSSLTFPAWMSFNPVKNNIADAAAKVKASLPPWSGFHSEADVYHYNCEVLRYAGAEVGQATNVDVGPLSGPLPPRVILMPNWVRIRSDVKNKVCGPLSLTSRSTLVVNGDDVKFQDVHLDGTIIVHAVKGAHVRIENIKCRTVPWKFLTATKDDMQSDAIVGVKGFRVTRQEGALVLNYTSPGNYVYNGKNTPSKL